MMRRFQLMLLLMLVATVTSNAQEMELTAAPVFLENSGFYEWESNRQEDFVDVLYSYYNVATIENADAADARLFYRMISYGEPTEWMEYTGETLYAQGPGEVTVEAYAQAEGKYASDMVSTRLYNYDIMLYSAFIVDGIHYYRQYEGGDWEYPSREIYVCSRKTSRLYSPPYSGDVIVPREVEFWYETHTVTGLRDHAFAATLTVPCSMTSVDLPSTIEYIEDAAFAGCVNLERMTIRALNPPESSEVFYYEYGDEDYLYYDHIGFDASQLYDQVKLFVPQESLEAYSNHYEWGKFTHIVPFIGAGPGDINGDGNISVGDVSGLISQVLSGEAPAYCDVDGDGNVSIRDVTILIRMVLSGN